MKIDHNTTIFIGDNSKNERYEKTQNNDKNKTGIIFAGDLNQNLDPIAKKRKEAQEAALKVVSDAFSGEKSIDDDMQLRRDHIDQLREGIKNVQDEIQDIDNTKEELRKSQGVDADSEEQKDLELIQKRNESIKPGSKVTLTEEDNERLAQIDENNLTDYQKQALQLESSKSPYQEEIDSANDEIIMENAIIRGVRLERLKSEPVLDAQKQAKDILDAASEEIKGMLVDEAKDHVDDTMEETQEKAEEKADEKKQQEAELEAAKDKSEQMEALANSDKEAPKKADNDSSDIPMENMLKLDKIKTDVQTEVENIADKMNLVIEDIKGAVVDTQV